MSRVPVHIVSGASHTSRSDLVRRMIAERASWFGLQTRSCPCCVGRVALQVNLVRLLREQNPARVFVDLSDPAHLGAFRRALNEWPLAQYLAVARGLRLPEDAALTADDLELDVG